MNFQFAFLTLISLGLSACNAQNTDKTIITQEAKDYWFNGKAEITSYKIRQARYGELREGYAVMIFVTEDFSTSKFSKSNTKGKDVSLVLKLNFTKNFTTGIYPYSIMTSSFLPFNSFDHAHKITTTIQEWCGHVYMEMTRQQKMQFEIKSYFEDESIKSLQLNTTWMEDELFSIIRLYPEEIPAGTYNVIPSFAYLRLLHTELKSYSCEISKKVKNDSTTTLVLDYPDLKRNVTIDYQKSFPYLIYAWTETYEDGFGENKKVLESTATKLKTIRLDYWDKNSNSDVYLRKELGLE